ncbi:hypothetical protein NDU88_006506 [Pleurodeles waltl]|uniref:Uncharacterized protein n=1 Tax=Pleurodeles waltl TaxID=8319 RepID=A0AAV7RS34_PLEWA|nr:hypothetical protein NDU88_006506 [Pleurodeles waltl]
MTYDAEGVINIRREDVRERSGEKKEEPRTRGSRSEEIAIGASEEEKETAVTGEPTTERETAITRGPEEEKDTVEVGESVAARGSTAIRVPRTEEETQKSGRLEGRRNPWATPGPDEEKSGDHPRAGRAPGGTWPSQGADTQGLRPDLGSKLLLTTCGVELVPWLKAILCPFWWSPHIAFALYSVAMPAQC